MSLLLWLRKHSDSLRRREAEIRRRELEFRPEVEQQRGGLRLRRLRKQAGGGEQHVCANSR